MECDGFEPPCPFGKKIYSLPHSAALPTLRYTYRLRFPVLLVVGINIDCSTELVTFVRIRSSQPKSYHIETHLVFNLRLCVLAQLHVDYYLEASQCVLIWRPIAAGIRTQS